MKIDFSPISRRFSFRDLVLPDSSMAYVDLTERSFQDDGKESTEDLRVMLIDN